MLKKRRCHLVGLDHEQHLAERAGALAQHLVRGHGDDGAEREDEGVNVSHVPAQQAQQTPLLWLNSRRTNL